MMTEQQKALASIVDADPRPRGGPLMLIYFGIVTAELDPITFALDHGIGHPDFARESWFNDYLAKALEMGGMLAVQKFGVSPAAFPGRLVVLWDFAARFTPALFVADRLITWGNKSRRKFCATDKPGRAADMRAALAWAESQRVGAATQ